MLGFFAALTNETYYYAGASFAVSLLHGGPAPRCFSSALFQTLLGKPQMQPSVNEVGDAAVRTQLQQVVFNIATGITVMTLLTVSVVHLLGANSVNFQENSSVKTLTASLLARELSAPMTASPG